MTCNIYCTECLKTQPFQASGQVFVCPRCSKHLQRRGAPEAGVIHRLPDGSAEGALPEAR